MNVNVFCIVLFVLVRSRMPRIIYVILVSSSCLLSGKMNM